VAAFDVNELCRSVDWQNGASARTVASGVSLGGRAVVVTAMAVPRADLLTMLAVMVASFLGLPAVTVSTSAVCIASWVAEKPGTCAYSWPFTRMGSASGLAEAGPQAAIIKG